MTFESFLRSSYMFLIRFINMFSLSVGLIFLVFLSEVFFSFQGEAVLNLMRSNSLIFSFTVAHAFGVIPKKSLTKPKWPAFSLLSFFYKFYWLKFYIYIYYLFCAHWYGSKFICIWISIYFSTICWIDYSFSTKLPLYLCQKVVFYTWVSMWALYLISLIYCLSYTKAIASWLTL